MRDVVVRQTGNHAWTEIGEHSRVAGSLQFMGRKSRRAEKGMAEKERSRGALILRWQAPCGRGSGVFPFSAHPVSAVIRERREPSVARRGTRASSAIIHPSSF